MDEESRTGRRREDSNMEVWGTYGKKGISVLMLYSAKTTCAGSDCGSLISLIVESTGHCCHLFIAVIHGDEFWLVLA